MTALAQTPAWKALAVHADALRGRHIAALFDDDARRAETFCADACALHLDFSKQLATAETLRLLQALAAQQDLTGWIGRLFAGDAVNLTEKRAALHMALRNVSGQPMTVAGQDVMAAVIAVRNRFLDFAEAVRKDQWRGAKGDPIVDVVNIGIGGSDLGPRMVCDALAPLADGPRAHFVANVDPAELAAVLRHVRPETTLFVVTSKTFTTQETMANAAAARRWLVDALGEAAVGKHFVAVSTNAQEVARFGIAADNMFGFWDWVGGRYSLWSAVGLSIAIAFGRERFLALLGGAAAMDAHFRTAPHDRNLPVLMGLLAVWNRNFLGCGSQAVIPYAHHLGRFVDWLQQLEMESNGKGVTRAGAPVSAPTTAVHWGGVGSNTQHAFFQMLHQGPERHALDFVLVAEPMAADRAQHALLLANGLAQSAALMRGAASDDPHRRYPGDRPSNTLVLPRLDPYHLGALLALYEHRTFVQSVLWDINAFDQWGVELGKRIAGDVLKALQGEAVAHLDGSTRRLAEKLRNS